MDSGRSLRVVLTTDYYFPYAAGGTEAVVRQLAEGLARRGHIVDVMALSAEAAPGYERLNNVGVHRFAACDLTRLTGLQLRFSLAHMRTIANVLGRLQPDVVNAHNVFFSSTPTTLAAARARGLPTMLTLHLNSPQHLPISGRLPATAYEAVFGRLCAWLADEIVCVGPSVARHAARALRLGHSPVVIPNGVDADRFSPAGVVPSRPVVLFVGRLLANKGPDLFVRAARQLLEASVDAEFWLVGDGPLRDRLERLRADEPRIRLLGQRADVPELMRAATILARPSTLEGFPLTILEAMASGLPVVATSIPGNVDLVEDGVTGALCAPRSASSLADALAQLLANPERSRLMGCRARRRVLTEYTWDAVLNAFERLASAMASTSHKGRKWLSASG